MNLFWFNATVLGLAGLVILCAWLRAKLKRTRLHVHNPSYYRKGDVLSMSGMDPTYNGRYKIVKIEKDSVTARRTFRGSKT